MGGELEEEPEHRVVVRPFARAFFDWRLVNKRI